ncbi:hypothetical protein WJX81_000170 [Elliptochloris bilobata]|uniref:t-SNARE coiled-coil homology domain-containing protein n=1 Tax=Elliptochloris bilobata TaxID=381761 RepID=A0AAW1SHD4_9CHLO
MAAYRAGGGYSRDGLSARAFGQAEPASVSIDVERPGNDFDSEIVGLSSQVSRLKQLSQAIGEENKLSRAAAEGLEETLDRAKAALSRGLKRVNRAMRRGRSNHMIYLVVFAFAVLMGVYVWAKLYRMVRWLV